MTRSVRRGLCPDLGKNPNYLIPLLAGVMKCVALPGFAVLVDGQSATKPILGPALIVNSEHILSCVAVNHLSD